MAKFGKRGEMFQSLLGRLKTASAGKEIWGEEPVSIPLR
ncbi:hypothetical protein CDSM653_02396 [Caldanaerobacter subterraneus subsp. pacificus DSM 12653]|uniref:Uncharacterized protein n=1 Tax=Caldanaerobacter subterraneus subsp. pacificus DSM 12653 TaxID=391606 RepID=A0A0F5PLB6_9THEO|nr:hypothetical protein CDSM653_02396 [Caldanaerobacter subterraneus subsp. pacificus DSM 12653]